MKQIHITRIILIVSALVLSTPLFAQNEGGEEELWEKSERLLDEGQFEQARQILLEYIRLHQEDNIEMAAATNNLGEIMVSMGQFQTAERYFIRSYNFYKELAKAQPEAFAYQVARSQHNLGSLYYQKQQYKHAKKYLTLALREREKLYVLSPIEFGAELIQTLNMLAAISCDQQKYSDAQSLYERALERLRLIEFPILYIDIEQAMTYNNMAIMFKKKGDIQKAESNYLLALQIYERAYDANPAAVVDEYIATLTNLSNLYTLLQRTAEADIYSNKAALIKNLKGQQ